jgi:plasmid stabilization system protein ParE
VPRIVVTEGAARGLEVCRNFLAEKNPAAARRAAARRAAEAILKQFDLLASYPAMGRPLDDHPELRELIIPFGDTGYVALYRHEPDDDAVYILAFRHQKEAGY